jgi:formate-dependent nitrite reductase membrane component NrfD
VSDDEPRSGIEITAEPETSTTYYERPAIKEPVWTWEVPAYFYVGGVAGAAAVIGAALQLLDDESEALVRRCRDIAALGGAAGTLLLISDLGRPERFLNMLRVFKPTSPLSVGSWILALASSMSVAAAVSSRMSGLAKRLGDLAGVGAGVAGLPLSGYTAVLVSDTVVPIWRESRKSLPMLFVASSTGAACSVLEAGAFTEKELEAVRRLGTIAQVAELVATKAVEREAGRVERVARPYNEGVSGTLWKASTSLTVTSLAVDTITGSKRGGRVAAALLGTVGSACLRVAVWQAGRVSARDPRATFELQRMQERDRERRQ